MIHLKKPIAEVEFEQFIQTLRSEIALEIKKKVAESIPRIPAIVAELLWDTPSEMRVINSATIPVLRRRAERLPLPQRMALTGALDRT